jgi:hypothetical protein
MARWPATSTRTPANRARRALRRDDFIVHEMQPDHLRPAAIRIIEVTKDGVADHLAELVEIIRFGDDRRANRVATYPPSSASSTIKRISVIRRASGKCPLAI